jgi:hypothetical protein
MEASPGPCRSRFELGEERSVEIDGRQLERDVAVHVLRRQPVERREIGVGHGTRGLLWRCAIADRGRQAIGRKAPADVERLVESGAGSVCGHAPATQRADARGNTDVDLLATHARLSPSMAPCPSRSYARAACGAPEFRTFKTEHQLARRSGSAYDRVTE